MLICSFGRLLDSSKTLTYGSRVAVMKSVNGERRGKENIAVLSRHFKSHSGDWFMLSLIHQDLILDNDSASTNMTNTNIGTLQ